MSQAMNRLLKTLAAAVCLGWGLAVSAAGTAALPPELSGHGARVIYLDFWASWCGPCAESFSWLNQMQQRYGDRLTVVGVNLDTDREAAGRFLKLHPATFDVMFDPAGRLAERYQLQAMPSSVIVDAKGEVLHRHDGFHDRERAAYEAAIVEALGRSAVVR